MSFQAVTWAIEQEAGSPSAKCVLWSIANYANEHWFAYPKQERIAADSEQSVDSVQKRNADLIARGLIRRVKLKRFGRRTFDFLILKPSPFFDAPIEDIRPFIPSGCDVIEEAAAECGSDINDSVAETPEDSMSDAAADGGSVQDAESDPTLPQSAVDATALLRQLDEPVTEPDSLPQTPSQESGDDPMLARKRESFRKFLDTYATNALTPTCSNPEAAFADWQTLSEEQEAAALQGARGMAEVRRRDPKAKGIVGANRYLRSSALWAEYSRFAPGDRAPTPRVFVEKGSDEWRARGVLATLTGRQMPSPKFDDQHQREGADFLGALPPAGLVLAPFADSDGRVDQTQWVILHGMERWIEERATEAERRDRPKIAAWAERVFECIGTRIVPGMIYLDGFVTVKKLDGSSFQARERICGLRVPSPWPPRKTPGTLATEEELNQFGKTG